MTQRNSWIQIGIVGKAHGLRGHFFISGRNEPPPSSCKLVRIGESSTEYEVEELAMRGQRHVFKLASIESREAVEPIIGDAILVPQADIEVDEDEFLWRDLIGREVLDATDQRIGCIEDVNNHGASDYVTIVGDDRRLLRIPLISEYVDMNFGSDMKVIKLAVEAEFFKDLWDD